MHECRLSPAFPHCMQPRVSVSEARLPERPYYRAHMFTHTMTTGSEGTRLISNVTTLEHLLELRVDIYIRFIAFCRTAQDRLPGLADSPVTRLEDVRKRLLAGPGSDAASVFLLANELWSSSQGLLVLAIADELDELTKHVLQRPLFAIINMVLRLDAGFACFLDTTRGSFSLRARMPSDESLCGLVLRVFDFTACILNDLTLRYRIDAEDRLRRTGAREPEQSYAKQLANGDVLVYRGARFTGRQIGHIRETLFRKGKFRCATLLSASINVNSALDFACSNPHDAPTAAAAAAAANPAAAAAGAAAAGAAGAAALPTPAAAAPTAAPLAGPQTARAVDVGAGDQGVLFRIKLHSSTAHLHTGRVVKSEYVVEEEFLFPPYSVFTMENFTLCRARDVPDVRMSHHDDTQLWLIDLGAEPDYLAQEADLPIAQYL
jgi:hypothetical protein